MRKIGNNHSCNPCHGARVCLCPLLFVNCCILSPELPPHFRLAQDFGPQSLCLLPVDDLPVFKANPTPLKRIVGMPDGSKIKSVGPLVKTDGMKAVRKSERSHIQVVHEFMAKRRQYRLTRCPLPFHWGPHPKSNFCRLDLVVAEEFIGQAPFVSRMRTRAEQLYV